MAKLDEVQSQIEEGFKTLAQQQEEAKKEQDTEIDLLKKRLLQSDASNRALADKVTSQEKWLSEVDAKANTARHGGTHAGDNLKNAIPSEYRHLIDTAERHGFKDPTDTAAKNLWWALQFKARMSMREPGKHAPGEYLKMADDLERGWGFDPVLKDILNEGAGGGGSNIIATPVEAELWRLIQIGRAHV